MIETEFTDRTGSLVALRSYWTGLATPFYAGEADYAFFVNVFSTAFAARLRAIGRSGGKHFRTALRPTQTVYRDCRSHRKR